MVYNAILLHISLPDAHERVYYKVSNGRCATRCHREAFCSCGTVGGKYVCACNAGFSGNGITCVRKYKVTLTTSKTFQNVLEGSGIGRGVATKAARL